MRVSTLTPIGVYVMFTSSPACKSAILKSEISYDCVFSRLSSVTARSVTFSPSIRCFLFTLPRCLRRLILYPSYSISHPQVPMNCMSTFRRLSEPCPPTLHSTRPVASFTPTENGVPASSCAIPAAGVPSKTNVTRLYFSSLSVYVMCSQCAVVTGKPPVILFDTRTML